MKKAAKISIIVLSVLVAIIGIVIGIFFLLIEPNVNLLGAPDLDFSKLTARSRVVTILDDSDAPINDVLYDKNKIYVSVDDLQDHTTNAFIAIEDKRFYSHGGIDYKRIASAALSNIKARKFKEGASTITQQLIKNTHLSNEKTIRRKLNEMRLARKLERIYDKETILECYLNILYFGSGIHGLGTASRVMFNKSAQELTLAQSAALAAIINNPSKYNPYKNADNLAKRKDLVLKQMLELNMISEAEYNAAKAEELAFNKIRRNQFTEGLLRSACREHNCSEKELFKQNRTFRTSYNTQIADSARRAIDDMVDFNGYIRVLVLDNDSGGIVCDETNSDTFIDARRSPASTIKPFVSYSPALENGYNPVSQINDVKTIFSSGYIPSNYRGIYRGWQSLEDCLIHSSNIAAVKLLEDVGIDSGIGSACRFGLPISENEKNLALALGGTDRGFTLEEIANAYRTIANGGIYSPTRYYKDIRHNTILNSHRVIGDDTAYLLTDMLKKCAECGTAKRLHNCGYIAAKTGTNGTEKGNTDCYCVAYTPKHTVAVWFGARDGEYIDNSITGASCCNIIEDMCKSGAIDTTQDFTMPDSVAYYEIDERELNSSHEVYLADPLLPKRYRKRVLLSKKHLPVRKDIDLIDYYDKLYWNDGVDFENKLRFNGWLFGIG